MGLREREIHTGCAEVGAHGSAGGTRRLGVGTAIRKAVPSVRKQWHPELVWQVGKKKGKSQAFFRGNQ